MKRSEMIQHMMWAASAILEEHLDDKMQEAVMVAILDSQLNDGILPPCYLDNRGFWANKFEPEGKP
jgi:hypothetical protein